MNPLPANFGKKASVGIVVGAALLWAGNGMTTNVYEAGEFWIVTSIITALCGWAAFIWGCMNLARWKGYSEWFGFFGYLFLLGLIILGCFPKRREDYFERQENEISFSRIGLVLLPLGIFVLFLGGAFVVSRSNVPVQEWTQVGSPEAGFQAVLPGKPEMQQKTKETPAGTIEINKYSVLLKKRNEVFMIIALRVPEEISRQPDTTEKLLEMAKDDVVSASHAPLESENEIVLGSCPGKELRLAPSIGAIKARVYATKSMAYEVSVLSSQARMSSADVQKFFDSFKLLAESGETGTNLESKGNVDSGAAVKVGTEAALPLPKSAPATLPVASSAQAQKAKPGARVAPPSGLAYWWRGEGNAMDSAGGNNGTLVGGVTFTAGEVGKAFNLDGSGFISTSRLITNPQNFSLSLWFKDPTRQGGVLISFDESKRSVANGSKFDRNIYMDNVGAIHFGVWNAGPKQIDSAAGYNDKKWHQVVGSLSADTGLSLYVDGILAGNNPAVTKSMENYNGYWRIGEDNLNNWPNQPASYYFKGQIDEVAIFNGALSPDEVAAIYSAGHAGMGRP
jgi:hypothetical protein